MKNCEKSKTTARLTQRNILKTIFRLAKPAFFRYRCSVLTYKNEITILYSGECRNTYFEIKNNKNKNK